MTTQKCGRVMPRGQSLYDQCERPIVLGTAACKLHNTVDRKRAERLEAWRNRQGLRLIDGRSTWAG